MECIWYTREQRNITCNNMEPKGTRTYSANKFDTNKTTTAFAIFHDNRGKNELNYDILQPIR